jgi:hypothetical protein
VICDGVLRLISPITSAVNTHASCRRHHIRINFKTALLPRLQYVSILRATYPLRIDSDNLCRRNRETAGGANRVQRCENFRPPISFRCRAHYRAFSFCLISHMSRFVASFSQTVDATGIKSDRARQSTSRYPGRSQAGVSFHQSDRPRTGGVLNTVLLLFGTVG